MQNKKYRVKEIFYTLQGEGYNAGRAAVFLRFSGCNLWSGREEDRHKGPSCSRWCDTDFLGTDGESGGEYGGEHAATVLAKLCRDKWPGGGRPLVVCTGGEPLLHLDAKLMAAMRTCGFEVAVETNGTIPLDRIGVWQPDHVCVSPKPNTRVVVRTGDEVKVVWPQPDLDLDEIAGWNFSRFYLQPMDGPDQTANVQTCIAYCLAHPKFRLSLQTHKLVGLP